VEDLPLNFDMVALLEARRGIAYCDRHADEPVTMYCVDCERDICVVCFARAHSRHRCDDVRTAAEGLRRQIDDDVERAAARLDEVRAAVGQLDDERATYERETSQLEDAIRRRGEMIKQSVDAQVTSLLGRVERLKVGTLRDIERRKERLELSLAAMDSFQSYSQEIKTKSRVQSMSQVASDLRGRVDDLLESSVSLRQYHPPAVRFVFSDVELEQNIVGKLSQCDTFTAGTVYFTVAFSEIS